MNHRPPTTRAPHRTRLAAGGLLLALGGSLIAAPAQAAPPSVTQDFSEAPGPLAAPAEWSIENENVAGMRDGWQGWSFHDSAEVVREFGAGGSRNGFARGSGLHAVVQSDSNRPSSGAFSSTLWSAPLTLAEDAEAVRVAFDSHYRQGQAPQNAQLMVQFDDQAPVEVERFAADRLNQAVTASADVPEHAETARFGWAYRQSSNNWYWMVDNVEITEAAAQDRQPTVLSAAKPVAEPGQDLTVRLGGLRPGQQAVVTLGSGAEAANVPGIPVAGSDGTVSFLVRVPAAQPAGQLLLSVAGAGIVPITVPVTVMLAGPGDRSTTEPQLWFDGFEGYRAGWERGGDSEWAFGSLDEQIAAHGTDRRQAFTRASGTIAVAEAAGAAFAGTLTSPSIPVTGGEALELRMDHHFRARGGAERATVTATFDSGERVELLALAGETVESAQGRLALTVPAGAAAVRFEFAFAAPAGSGSWMLDDAQLVRPLAPLAAGAEARAVVDIFSDVQGANARLRDQVLPGFAGLPQRADTIVSNGDLVSQGYADQYRAYRDAFAAGGGNDYGTVVSTIGNHEYYGTGTGAAFRERFLDTMEMRDTGGEGGLWGEVLVDDALPLLWLGSEGYEYSEKTGSGPFVSMSDRQFTWLQGRLAHWSAQNTPVLLMSHQVFANSVSGTYINFYKNDFDQDTSRIQRLLQDNPNVIVMTSHTHWAPQLNDWSVEQRFDPARAQAPTIVNTAAVTSQYGPSGDWGETAVGGAEPVGLQAALYEDRVRVTAYAFAPSGGAEIKHIDVPLPAEA
ncbi:metallophosphoesterase family protein, partial [Leucobacter sp. M11]|uniref:metallophosphoesterase family protein n=1 Tax=Leucobacter sp. M11 TaxID=2993565 RepID=UPI002D7EF483